MTSVTCQGSVEILVHVSAPSTGKHDAHYRGLASAYLAFEPASKSNLTPSTCNVTYEEAKIKVNVVDLTKVIGREAENQLQDVLRESQSQWEEEQTEERRVFHESDGEDSYSETQSQSQAQSSLQKKYLTRSHLKADPTLIKDLVSPQVSFDSVLDNADSPKLLSFSRIPKTRPENQASQEKEDDTWEFPLSEVAETQSPCNRPIPQFSSPTRALELYLQHFPSPGGKINSDTEISEGSQRAKGVSSEVTSNSSQALVISSVVAPVVPVATAGSSNSNKVHDEHSSIMPSSPPVLGLHSSAISSRIDVETSHLLPDSSPSPSRPDPRKRSRDENQIPVESKNVKSNESPPKKKPRGCEPVATVSIQKCSGLLNPPRITNQGSSNLLKLIAALDPHIKPTSSFAEKGSLPANASSLPESISAKHPPKFVLSDHVLSQSYPPPATSSQSQTIARLKVPPNQKTLDIFSDAPRSSVPSILMHSSQLSTSSLLNRNQKPATKSKPAIKPPPVTKLSNYAHLHEIHPPPPQTSSSTTLVLLTPHLSNLATRLSLSSRYRPITQTRQLLPMERGYWEIDPGRWVQSERHGRENEKVVMELRAKAWDALGLYIARGRAGWGVWCCRDLEFVEMASTETESDTGKVIKKQIVDETTENKVLAEEKSGKKVEKWRVYCWGELVGHVYLLLYLVSERRVKGTGAKWIDGDGKVAIIMEGG